MTDKDKTLLQQLAETAKQLPPHGFQSMHPVGGATDQAAACRHAAAISIHAPRGGCDHHVITKKY